MEGHISSKANLPIDWTPYTEAIETGRSVPVYDNGAGRYDARYFFQTFETGSTSAHESQAMPSPVHGIERTGDVPKTCCCKWYVRSPYFHVEIT